MHGQQGVVTERGSKDYGLMVMFPGNSESIACYPTELSPDPPPPLPGGYSVGELVYYTGGTEKKKNGDRVLYGARAEVTGPAGDDGAAYAGKGLALLFEGNKHSYDSLLTTLSRDPPRQPSLHRRGVKRYCLDRSSRAKGPGEVVGPATGSHVGKGGIRLRFPDGKLRDCRLEDISQEPPVDATREKPVGNLWETVPLSELLSMVILGVVVVALPLQRCWWRALGAFMSGAAAWTLALVASMGALIFASMGAVLAWPNAGWQRLRGRGRERVTRGLLAEEQARPEPARTPRRRANRELRRASGRAREPSPVEEEALTLRERAREAAAAARREAECQRRGEEEAKEREARSEAAADTEATRTKREEATDAAALRRRAAVLEAERLAWRPRTASSIGGEAHVADRRARTSEGGRNPAPPEDGRATELLWDYGDDYFARNTSAEAASVAAAAEAGARRNIEAASLAGAAEAAAHQAAKTKAAAQARKAAAEEAARGGAAEKAAAEKAAAVKAQKKAEAEARRAAQAAKVAAAQRAVKEEAERRAAEAKAAAEKAAEEQRAADAKAAAEAAEEAEARARAQAQAKAEVVAEAKGSGGGLGRAIGSRGSEQRDGGEGEGSSAAAASAPTFRAKVSMVQDALGLPADLHIGTTLRRAHAMLGIEPTAGGLPTQAPQNPFGSPIASSRAVTHHPLPFLSRWITSSTPSACAVRHRGRQSRARRRHH